MVALLAFALGAFPAAAQDPWTTHGPGDVLCDAAGDDLDDQRRKFWQVADWGVVPSYRERLVEYCTADGEGPASSMRCTPDLLACQARGLRLDVPARGEGGEGRPVGVSTSARCVLSESFPRTGIGLRGLTLSDWSPELQFFAGAAGDRPCDVRIRQPTLLIKPDSPRNIYHGICDHANLYLSMDRRLGRGRRPRDRLLGAGGLRRARPLAVVRAVRRLHHSAGQTPRSLRRPERVLRPGGARRQPAVAPHLLLQHVRPRPRCRLPLRAGRLPAVLRRADQGAPARQGAAAAGTPPAEGLVRVKIMSRSKGTGRTSGTRHVTNEAELAGALRRCLPGVEVEVVNFDWNGRPPIAGQVALMAGTDILIGMHGAGLVHTLWLPPWAVVFEIYNCGDVHTYRDLARLMGVGYLTGQASDLVRHAPGVPVAERSKENPKFWNYQLDEDAYVARVEDAVRRVREHPSWPFHDSGTGPP